MKRWCGLVLPLIIGAVLLCGYVAPKDRKYVDYFLKLHAADLFRSKSFLLNSSWAYVSRKGIERIDMSFSFYRVLTVNQARELIVTIAQELAEKLNSDSEIRKKNLLFAPFSPSQLRLEIKTDNVISKHSDVESIQRIILDKGTITYHSYPASQLLYGRSSVYKESYEQAMMFLDLPTEFEPEEAQAEPPPEKYIPFSRRVESPETVSFVTPQEDTMRRSEDSSNMLGETPAPEQEYVPVEVDSESLPEQEPEKIEKVPFPEPEAALDSDFISEICDVIADAFPEGEEKPSEENEEEDLPKIAVESQPILIEEKKTAPSLYVESENSLQQGATPTCNRIVWEEEHLPLALEDTQDHPSSFHSWQASSIEPESEPEEKDIPFGIVLDGSPESDIAAETPSLDKEDGYDWQEKMGGWFEEKRDSSIEEPQESSLPSSDEESSSSVKKPWYRKLKEFFWKESVPTIKEQIDDLVYEESHQEAEDENSLAEIALKEQEEDSSYDAQKLWGQKIESLMQDEEEKESILHAQTVKEQIDELVYEESQQEDENCLAEVSLKEQEEDSSHDAQKLWGQRIESLAQDEEESILQASIQESTGFEEVDEQDLVAEQAEESIPEKTWTQRLGQWFRGSQKIKPVESDLEEQTTVGLEDVGQNATVLQESETAIEEPFSESVESVAIVEESPAETKVVAVDEEARDVAAIEEPSVESVASTEEPISEIVESVVSEVTEEDSTTVALTEEVAPEMSLGQRLAQWFRGSRDTEPEKLSEEQPVVFDAVEEEVAHAIEEPAAEAKQELAVDLPEETVVGVDEEIDATEFGSKAVLAQRWDRWFRRPNAESEEPVVEEQRIVSDVAEEEATNEEPIAVAEENINVLDEQEDKAVPSKSFLARRFSNWFRSSPEIESESQAVALDEEESEEPVAVVEESLDEAEAIIASDMAVDSKPSLAEKLSSWFQGSQEIETENQAVALDEEESEEPVAAVEESLDEAESVIASDIEPKPSLAEKLSSWFRSSREMEPESQAVALDEETVEEPVAVVEESLDADEVVIAREMEPESQAVVLDEKTVEEPVAVVEESLDEFVIASDMAVESKPSLADRLSSWFRNSQEIEPESQAVAFDEETVEEPVAVVEESLDEAVIASDMPVESKPSLAEKLSTWFQGSREIESEGQAVALDEETVEEPVAVVEESLDGSVIASDMPVESKPSLAKRLSSWFRGSREIESESQTIAFDEERVEEPVAVVEESPDIIAQDIDAEDQAIALNEEAAEGPVVVAQEDLGEAALASDIAEEVDAAEFNSKALLAKRWDQWFRGSRHIESESQVVAVDEVASTAVELSQQEESTALVQKEIDDAQEVVVGDSEGSSPLWYQTTVRWMRGEEKELSDKEAFINDSEEIVAERAPIEETIVQEESEEPMAFVESEVEEHSSQDSWYQRMVRFIEPLKKGGQLTEQQVARNSDTEEIDFFSYEPSGLQKLPDEQALARQDAQEFEYAESSPAFEAFQEDF